jgi:hypothetical protein
VKKDETPWTWQEVIMELFKDEKFLDLTNRTIDTWKNIQDRRINIEEKRIDSWKSITKIFIIGRFILSFFAMIGLGFALKEKFLSVESTGVLFGLIIASLFIPPRKE